MFISRSLPPDPKTTITIWRKQWEKQRTPFFSLVVCLYCVREERCWIGPVNLVTLFILSRQRRKWEIIFLTFFHQHIIKHLFALWFTLSTFSDVVNVLTFSSHIICYTSLTVPFVSVQQNNAVWELHLKLKWFIILPGAEHLFEIINVVHLFFPLSQFKLFDLPVKETRVTYFKGRSSGL